MAEPVIQSSFSSGELSPTLLGRVDLAQYKSGLALIRNWFVDYRGGVSTRTGTQFIGRAFNDTQKVRLVPFEYSSTATYILEFGHQYIRVIKNGGYVLNGSASISNITTATPGVVSLGSSPSWSVGDTVFINGVGGMNEINGQYAKIYALSGSTLTLGTLDTPSVPLSTINYTPYTSGGTIWRVYVLTTTYSAADLALLKFSQLASVMTITHPSYAPANLTYAGDASWTLSNITFGSTLVAPGAPTVTPSATGSTYFSYCITAVDSNGQESSASSNGNALSVDIGTTAGSIQLTWAAVSGAVSYNVYKYGPSYSGYAPSGAILGFIGSATGTTFTDINISANYAITPPQVSRPFSVGNYPSVSCYFQQRQTYAATSPQPQTFWMSQPGAANNFNYSIPAQDSDAIIGTLVSNQVNAVKSLIPMPGGLIALTSKGAWQISGGGATSPITPTSAQATPQAYNGASDVPPLVINEDILYVQSKGGIVRDLAYNIYVNIYTGTDITVLSNHLFLNHNILEWAWAEEPYKVVWAVRDDGTLLSLTYIKAQQILGWAHSDTLGVFESVATITENQVNAVYVVVRRLVNGQYVRYIERFKERTFTYGVEDAWCVDAALETTPTGTPSAGLTISAATGTVTLTADSSVSWNVGDIVRAGGGIITLTSVVGLTATGTVTQALTNTTPNDPNNTPLPIAAGSWTYTTPFTTINGLSHLAGQTVTGLADGSVIVPQTVSANGTITLPNQASKAIIGLAFTAQLETLPIDVGGEPTIQGKRKKLSGLTMRVDSTRGLSYGRTLSSLVPVKERSPSMQLGVPIPLQSTDQYVNLDPLWDDRGQFYIVQSNPLPATVLALIPILSVGDTSK